MQNSQQAQPQPQPSRSLFDRFIDFSYDAVKPTGLPGSGYPKHHPLHQSSTESHDQQPQQQQQQQEQQQEKKQQPTMRRAKWEYAIPIVFTPVAHICVSLIRKYPQHKTKLYWGVGVATFLTIQARMILMYDAGYPGAESPDPEGLPTFLKILLF